MSKSLPKSVIDPKDRIEPPLTATGIGSIKPKTVIEVFKATVDKFGNNNAIGLKRTKAGEKGPPSEWKFWTWQEYYDDCTKFAKSLIHLNIEAFGIVNIIGFNSPEWLIANNGAMMAGCIAAGIYSTNLPEACHYISDHSKAGIIAVEDNKQLQKYSSLLSDPKKQLPFLKAIIVWGEPIDPKIKCGNVKIYSWNDFLALGTTVQDSSIETRLSKILPGNCSTLIYTSGTTGNPKAVMISHDNVTWTAMVMGSQYMHFDHNERSVSYLPLSHIAAQILDIHVPMFLGSTLYFCQPDALKGSLTVTLTDVKPTFFFGVPRVWEKVQETMVQKGREVSGVLRMIATWAKGRAAEKNRLRQVGEKGGFLKLGYVIGFIVAFAFYQTFLSTLVEVSAQYPLISVISKLDDVTVFAVSVVLSFIVNFSTEISYFVASKVILSKIHEKVGLNKCKACFTAAAPISVDTLSYFASIDIPVFEVFGQSECTGPHTVSAPGQWRIGYCGRPMPGTESMIAKDTNELCYRGRHIMMGYMYMRDKTDEAIDADGYLHSGDVAEFDENEQKGFTGPSGFMRITGRIKELIITAGGENIPPVLIENEMKAAMNAISNCMVIGDKKKFLTILISLKTEVDKETGVPTDKLAADSLHAGKQIGSKATTISEAAKDPVWDKYLTDGIKLANSKTTSQAQIVQKYKLLPVDFSEKGGELTPTLKLKRNIATEKYKDLIESMYAE